MPKKTPNNLRVYVFHGVEFGDGEGDEAIGTCPFCGKENKFSVNLDTSLFRCWSGECDISGNSSSFLGKFWKHCLDNTTDSQYRSFARESGLETTRSLKKMGCAFSVLKHQWVVPGFTLEGKVTGLYRFGKIKDKGKWIKRLLISPGGGTHLLNVQNVKGTERIFMTEGWRDALAWMETTKDDVVSLTGAGVLQARFLRAFENKDVVLLFDANEAGIKGVRRAASILMSTDVKPKSISYLNWEGVQPGTDVRDYLQGKGEEGKSNAETRRKNRRSKKRTGR